MICSEMDTKKQQRSNHPQPPDWNGFRQQQGPPHPCAVDCRRRKVSSIGLDTDCHQELNDEGP